MASPAVLTCVLGALAVVICHVQCAVQLTEVSTVYLPHALTPTPQYGLDTGSVERLAYHHKTRLIYAIGYSDVTGSGVFHVVNATDPTNLVREFSRVTENLECTDVAVCGDVVFVTLQNLQVKGRGQLQVYNLFDPVNREITLIRSIEVGSQPDMLQARFDCNTVVIALEGGGYKDSSGAFHDPEGAVVTVKFPNGPRGSAQPVVNTLDFRKYNQRFDTLEPSGVRFVYRDNNSFSNDVEPEFVTLDEKSHTAYVCLQENNAIAVVDLTSENIEHVYGLGFKHWGHFDASNKDQGIQISYWPIRAWYQPDAVLFYTFQGRRLIFSANEGHAKEYLDFDETERGKKLQNVSATVPEFVRASLQDDALLGRLKFSSVDGKDEQGNYQHLYTYGGRSFSVWDADQGMTQIYDSGSHIEESTALHCPHLFNMDGNDEQPDSRSDDKGPEPESLALAEVRGRLYVFVGNERPGTISVYSFGSDLTKPRFETIFCDGIPDDSRTPDQRFADRDLFAVDPEDIQYLSEEESPAPYPVLLVAGTVSGTVSIVRVNITDEPGDGDPKPPNNGNTYAAGSVWVLAASLLVTWFKTREISA